MPKQNQKTSTTGNSHSYIFSDASRAIYREQSLTRKLKHMQQQNINLQQKIQNQQNQIKDQRTVIIYQMGQLAKAVNTKLNVFEDYKITKNMFMNEDQAHQSLKLLMNKFQNIEKQEKMITKVRNNLQKMYEIYTQHKKSIQQIMAESSQTHRQNEQKMKTLIHQKRAQLQNLQQQNTFTQQEIERMKHQMQQFDEQQEQLNNRQKQLRKAIQEKQKKIKQQYIKFDDISKWTEIVIDKRHRYDLYDGIKNKRKELSQVQICKNKIELALKEESLIKY